MWEACTAIAFRPDGTECTGKVKKTQPSQCLPAGLDGGRHDWAGRWWFP